MKLQVMYSFLKSDLDKVEQELKQIAVSNDPLLAEAALALIEAGGKRIRPVFVLLAGKFGAYKFETIKHVAVALELIHMASLVHDDVIDNAYVRRGCATVNARWGDKVAMYTGDYLFAKSLECITNLEMPEIHKVLSHTMVELCKGEIEQIRDKYNFNQNLRTYLRRIKRKTALLIASSCQLGAVAAGADEQTSKRLFWFGYFVGMSYQIIDDILDFMSNEEELGKPAGEDLRQGNITLPVLYAMETPAIKRKLETVHAGMDRADMQYMIHLIKDGDAIERSFELSERYLQKALKIIQSLPKSQAKSAMQSIAKYIGKRKF
ncbi:heptaprenyl diphosphate synthase component II [Ectobacillus sp. JY-23]|uniref:heptaprenyl diphosphate synthase component II n=1 Tax=Ectobacillus sp. JY-23 TaxID=2933872 RepID=UPI001FF40CAF|nr:heptaprenyl diphosphate synthase component II [Ectobacillus sp. JY-23]UOY93472.1 heptaprenyl diphosphate synthase component II [Ectobacillus sp. JY-23]